jgi:glycosyltransferase involved in cell wall biosynthesis
MRVLAISSWWPEPADNGSRMRIAHLLRGLARDHEVHLVALAQTPVSEAQSRRMEQQCASARSTPQRTWVPRRADLITSLWLPEPASIRATRNPEFAALVRERAAAVRPDLVIAFQLTAAPYARLVGGVPRVLEELEVAYILEQYTRQSRGLRRLRSWLTWRKHRAYVAGLLRDFAACSVVSARELAYVRPLAPPEMPIAVIPNGADVEGCEGSWGAPDTDTLIYPGALSFDANYDAMAHFLGDSFPLIKAARPEVRLRITGKAELEQRASLPPAADVEFTGYVPDVRPLVARSWCEIVPLRKGGGTRLKILEALALGTPVVSTSKGAEGLNLEDGRHLLIADSPADFAATTLQLLSRPELRSQLSLAGRQAVRERYDWRVIGRQLNALVHDVAGSGGKAFVNDAT